MLHTSDPISTDIESYLAEHEHKDLLRLLTCGSVDDGKSTLIGRLLHDAGLIYADHLAALEADSLVSGTTGDKPDLALLMDGLRAEREQGITIDVAYRYVSTARRTFIIADTPGHVQYTRNMVTGASTAQLAIILIDARQGVLEQTRRHATIASLLGIRHVVVAVNKMDLIGYSRERFERVRSDYLRFARDLTSDAVYVLPISALQGDNVVDPSAAMGWHDGPPLLEHLETVDIRATEDRHRLRLPIQLVSRPDLHFRGFVGTIASGTLRPGDEIVALPSGVRSRIARIVTFDGDLEVAGPGQAVTVTLTDEIDVSRGDWIVGTDDHPQRAHELEATVVWLAERTGEPGRQYLLRSVNGPTNASIRRVEQHLGVVQRDHRHHDALALNDIARCTVTVDREVLFDPYLENRTTGSFVLIDRISNATVAAGTITGVPDRWDRSAPAGMTRRRSEITSAERAARFEQRPATVLLTGMTGAGKSTVAAALERRLFDQGRTVLRLDGQNLRLGISRDLGFSDADRSENLRRAAEIAHLANLQGLIVVIALQAPEAAVRARARALLGDGYVEVHLDAPEATRRARDPHGLYRAADRGELARLPGATSPYEAPNTAELALDTATATVEQCVEAIVDLLERSGVLPAR